MTRVRPLPANDIRPTLVSDLVHDRLLASIVSGELQPGDRLRLDEIARRYGVSRTPVREAVTRLARNNFVLVSRYTSTVVAPWSTSGIRERVTAITAMAAAGVLQLSPTALQSLGVTFARIAQPEQRTVVDLIDAVLAAAYPRLGEQLRDDLIAPVRLYFGGSTAAGSDLEELAAWAPGSAALLGRDHDRLAHSLGSAAAALIATLRVSEADAASA